MKDTIMLGAWGLGRRALISGGPVPNVDYWKMLDAAQRLELNKYHPKIIDSVEYELTTTAAKPSFALSPLSRKSIGSLDIAPFILYDKVVMDVTSYSWLINNGSRLPLTRSWAADESISILEGLKDKGILELRDYSEILDTPQQVSVLRTATYLDISDTLITDKAWIESIRIWIEFLKGSKGTSKDTDAYLENIISQLQVILDRLSRGVVDAPGVWAWMYLVDCISDVNCTLLVSRMLDLPFLDWNDYQPFYEYKFLRAFRQLERHEDLDSFRRLFEVFVPHFKVRHVDEILALRQDKRLEAVKALARATRPDEVSSEMVRQALSDALKMKDKALGFNRVVSLITIPIGFIPIWGDPLQILVQDIVERVYRSHLEKKYEWQCFFVDLHTDYRYEVLQDRLDSAHPM